jgi:hypothetical protein
LRVSGIVDRQGEAPTTVKLDKPDQNNQVSEKADGKGEEVDNCGEQLPAVDGKVPRGRLGQGAPQTDRRQQAFHRAEGQVLHKALTFETILSFKVDLLMKDKE